MSSRASRRSCSNANQLNRALIPLWDKKRLVKELQERNLDTSGTQPDLADRLLAFLDGILVPAASPAPEVATPKPAAGSKKAAKKTPAVTPKTPKSAKKTPKGKKKPIKEIKQEPEEEEEDEEEKDEDEADVSVAVTASEEPEPEEETEAEATAQGVNGAVRIKEEPPDEVEQDEEGPSEPVTQGNRRSSRKQNKENNTPAAKKKEPKKRPVVVKIEPVDDAEDVPSTSASTEQAPVEEPVAPQENGDASSGRSRRKSARLLASEQMEVEEPTTEEEEPTPEPEQMEVDTEPSVEEEAEPESVVPQVKEEPTKHKEKERKTVRIKTESDSDEGYGKGPQPSSSSDPDFDVVRHSKRIKEHHDSFEGHNIKHERPEKVKKIRPSSSSTTSAPVPAPAPPPKPKQADWQLKWAEKMKEHKKTVPEKKEKPQEAKRKESGDKTEVQKKKKVDGGGKSLETIDTITALMSSSIVKKEKIEKKVSIEQPARIGGGSDASSDYHQTPYSRGSSSSHHPLPMISPQPTKQYPTGMFFNQAIPAAKPPPVAFPPPPPMMPMPVGLPLPPPPPPPAVPKRRSRFDQPPADCAPNFFPKANAPPPTLTTAIQISRRSPIPPPPPRRRDDIPPPPPKPASLQAAVPAVTSDLQRRVQELFAGDVASPVPVVFSPQLDAIPPPPPKPVETGPTKRPLVKVEVEEDDDDEFVIRDTVVQTKEVSEPAPKMMKMEMRDSPAPLPSTVALQDAEDHTVVNGFVEDGAPKAINKVEEQKKKEAIAEERRRRAMELGDGEYDPFETTGNDETTLVYEYQPTNPEDRSEETDDEMMEGEDEEEFEGEEEGGEEMGDEEEEFDETAHDRGSQESEDEDELNVHDGKDLLKLLNTVSEQKKTQYKQVDSDVPTDSLLTRQEDEKPEEVYYHGEPVPEVDENELYEIAAGIKPKKKEKKALVQIPDEERLPTDAETIELDYYNADIHVKSAEKNIWQIEPFCQDGLALMWGGVRSNFGIELPFKKTDKDKATRLGFQIQVDAYQSIQHLPTEFMNDGGDVRIGFSLGSAPLVLGEYTGTWCISATGKQATNNHFLDFGHSFNFGDVVTCILDLEDETISYMINGKPVGSSFQNIGLRDGDIIYPTICTKNANVTVNLGQEMSEKWKIDEERDWMFITEMDRSHLIRSHVAPAAKKDCTVLMTVGLPGTGKSTWVRRYLAEHPHEHWTLISGDVVMDAMKVNGVSRIRLPTLKRPDFLRGIIGKSIARLILLAPRRRKNYILDMTNCFSDKRKRKLMAFEEFNRKCMVFVPDEHEHQNRLIKQEHEENEKLDTDALMQHKAGMSLPSIEAGDPCEEVIFIDPPAPHEHIAVDRVAKMNYDCRSWLIVPGGRRRGGGHFHGHNNHHGNRGYHNDNYGGGGGGGSYQYNRPSTSGSQNQYNTSQNSPRAMNITHTTFQSNNSQQVAPSPRVRFADEQPSSAPSPIILPPVHIKPQVASAQPSPVVSNNFSFPPVQPKVEVSQPLTLNTSQPPRKSIDASGPSPALSSGGRSSFSSNSPAPRFTPFTPKESTTPKTPMTPTPSSTPVVPIPVTISVPPPPLGQPSPLLMSQPPPLMQMRPPVPMFPIDVTVPPPNFSAPPPPLPGVLPPQMLYQHQMSVPPPPSPQQFSYPPPQFAPR